MQRAAWVRKPDNTIDLTKARTLVGLDNPPMTDPTVVRTPLYEAKADPDIYFFGFDLTIAEVGAPRMLASNGGALLPDLAASRAVWLALSGPAGGIQGAALVGAALRLMPLGQLAGQRILWNMQPLIANLAEEVQNKTRFDMWSFAPLGSHGSRAPRRSSPTHRRRRLPPHLRELSH